MPAPSPIDVVVIASNPRRSAGLTRAIRAYGLATDVAGDAVELRRLVSRSVYRVAVFALDGARDDAEKLAWIGAEEWNGTAVVTISAPGLQMPDGLTIAAALVHPVEDETVAATVFTLVMERAR